MKRFRSLLAGMMIAAAGLSASAMAADDDTLVVGAAVNSTSLSPSKAYNALALASQTWETLVWRDADDNLVPTLAVSWEELEPTRWRFKLREGVTWHDGTPFTAEDAAWTINYVINPDTVYGRKSRISKVAGAEVVDALTVDILTKGPSPTLLLGLAEIPIEQKAISERLGVEEAEKTPIGTGPWKAVEWVPGSHYKVTRNDEHWGDKPKFKNLEIRMIPDASTRVLSLLAGETDIIANVPADLVPTIIAKDNLSVVSKESSVSFVLNFDTRTAPFNDPKVREAVDLAINKVLLNERMLDGRASLLDGQLVTAATFGHNDALSPTPYDLEKAKEILSGVTLPDGFRNEIMLVPGRYISDLDMANAIADMLTQAGLPTTVNPIEDAVWTTLNGEMKLGAMHAVGWFNLGDADFSTVWYTDGGKRNYWHNDEFETLFAEARNTTDAEARKVAYDRMAEIMNEERPAVFMYGLPQIAGVNNRVLNFQQSRDPLIRLQGVELRKAE